MTLQQLPAQSLQFGLTSHDTLPQGMMCDAQLQQRALQRTAAAALDGVWLLY